MTKSLKDKDIVKLVYLQSGSLDWTFVLEKICVRRKIISHVPINIICISEEIGLIGEE